MKNKIVFFDFDGVIVDTYKFCFDIVQSREYITEEEYRRRFDGNIHDAVRKLKDPNSTAGDFTARYIPELMKCQPVKEMDLAIRKLAEKYTLIIVSSTASKPIDDYLVKVGLRECFTEILGADVDKSKVNKINASLKKYAVEPEEAFFITDTLGDMREADKCNVESIAVTGGYHDEIDLKRGRPLAIAHSGADVLRVVESYLS